MKYLPYSFGEFRVELFNGVERGYAAGAVFEQPGFEVVVHNEIVAPLDMKATLL